MVAYIILCNLQNTNLQILPAKTLPANPTISYQQKKERRNKKDLKQFCWYLPGFLGEFPEMT